MIDTKSNSKTWYDFYGENIRKYWKSHDNRTLNDLYHTLAELHTEGCDPKTVQDNFVRGEAIPEKLLPGVLLLLVETDFFQNLFDIGMSTRRDLLNSERMLFKFYHMMKSSVAGIDYFWGRWVLLFELRYDSKLLSNGDKLQLFAKIEERLGEAHFKDELKKLKKIRPEMIKDLTERLELFEEFFVLTFNIAYLLFLKEYFKTLSEDETKDRKKYQEKIRSLESATDSHIVNLEKKLPQISQNNLYISFQNDFRNHKLYYFGYKLQSYEGAALRDLSKEARESHLKEVDKLLNVLKPEITDNISYNVMYDYYKFSSMCKTQEHLLLGKNYRGCLDAIAKTLEFAEALEIKSASLYPKILLKVKYRKRELHFIKDSVETFLIEKQMEDPDNYEYMTHEHHVKKKENVFESIQSWMRELRREIFL